MNVSSVANRKNSLIRGRKKSQKMIQENEATTNNTKSREQPKD